MCISQFVCGTFPFSPTIDVGNVSKLQHERSNPQRVNEAPFVQRAKNTDFNAVNGSSTVRESCSPKLIEQTRLNGN